MKALVAPQYGSPEILKVIETEIPVPAENEVLLRICSASVTAADTMMRKGSPYWGRLFLGIRRPKFAITGTGFAGTVEAKGANVRTFDIGDRVFGEVIFRNGSHAEYACVPEDGIIARLPANVSFDEAAPVGDGLMTALNFLTIQSTVAKGERILVIGASGAVGSAAVQVAKMLGANVTGVCSSSNVDMVFNLGADNVIDYASNSPLHSDAKYDYIFDAVGKSNFADAKKLLTTKGIYMSSVLSVRLLLQMLLTSRSSGRRAIFAPTGILPVPELRRLLNISRDWLANGSVRTIVTSVFTLSTVAEAHRLIETGRKRGNYVVRISS